MDAAPPLISVELLRYVTDSLKSAGMDVAPLLADAKIDPAALREPDRMIPLASYVRLFERAAAVTGQTHLGLRLGLYEDVGALGALGHLFMAAPSLLSAFEAFTSHLHALQEGTINRLSMSGDSVVIEYRIASDAITHRRQDAEYSISATNTLAHLYSAGTVRPLEVYFEHRQAGKYAVYKEHFGCDVFFEQPYNALLYKREGFNVRSVSRNKILGPIIASHLDMLLEKRTPATRCAAQVLRLLEQGARSEPEIAAKQGVSVATLGRRLRAEGTSFRAILSAHRLGMAKRLLLSSDRAISEIALAVGYAENASFTRAFRRHMGVGPDAYRRAGGGGDPSRPGGE